MARISTGNAYGPTTRQTSQRLLGGEEMPSLSGAIDVRGINAPAISPQANPVNTFVQAGAPTLGGPVVVPRPPDLPAPNGDLGRLAQALGGFSPVLQQVGETYVNFQKQQEEKAKQRGADAAIKATRFGAFSSYGEALREIEKRAAVDPSVLPLLTELRALDPRALPYAQLELQDALIKQRMGSIKEELANTVQLPDGRNLESVSPDDPAFFKTITDRLLPEGVSPAAVARNQSNLYSLFGSLRADQAKRRADFNDEQVKVGFSRGLQGDVTLLYSGMIGSQDLAGRLSQRLDNLYANSRPSMYREMRGKLLDNLAEAAVAASAGDPDALDRIAPTLAEALEMTTAGRNGEPLIDQFDKPRDAVINDFYRKLMTGVNTDRGLQETRAKYRGEDAADNHIKSYLTPDVLNDPAMLQARIDALPQLAVQLFPDDSNAQLAFMTRVQNFATNYSKAYIAPIQRDMAADEYANQAMNPSSDPTADIRRYTEMFRNRLIDESDYKALIAGARARNEKLNDRNYDTLRSLSRDLQQRLTEQFNLTTEGDGKPGVSPQEAVQIRQAVGAFYRSGEELIQKTPGGNLDSDLGDLFLNFTTPKVKRGEQRAQQPASATPEDIAKTFSGDRGNAGDNARLRRQAETRPLYGKQRMGQQLDEILTGKPLDDATRQIIRRTGMKPSDFFIQQMELHGVPLNPEVQQQLRKLDGTDKVSSAQPAGGTGGLAMIQPGRTSSMAQRLWRQWTTAVGNTLAPQPAGARDTAPFTGSGSAAVPTGSRVALSNVPPQTRALLRTIRYAEGTAHADGYRTMFTGAKFNDLSRHPRRINRGNGLASDAAGAYQFLSTTWDSVGGGAMTPERQDLAALRLVRGRGVDWKLPNGFTKEVADRLAPEWASFPTIRTGTSYYGQGGKSFAQLKAYYDRVLREEMARGR